jgi:hypothetical protein
MRQMHLPLLPSTVHAFCARKKNRTDVTVGSLQSFFGTR